MYRIALLYLALCLLASLGLKPLSAEDPAAGKPAAKSGTKWKKEDFQPAEACKTCHPQHYEEWRGSMHAYAITDPVFHAMHRLAQKETEGAIGDFCIGCHAPVGTGTGEVTASTSSPEGLSKTALAAVSCEVCHRSVHLEDGPPSNARFSIKPGAPLVGGLPNPQQTPAHASVTNDSLKNPDFCGSCHNVVNRKGIKIEKPHEEFLASPYPARDTSCLNCHMQTYTGRATPDGPLRNRLHRHDFIGVDVAVTPFPRMGYQRREVEEFLRTAARLSVFAPEVAVAGESFKLKVDVKNVGAGHNLPTGPSTEREMWLEVIASNRSGKVLFESGTLDKQGDLRGGHGNVKQQDPQLALFSDRFVDEKGETVFFMWQAHALEEHTIPALQTRSADYEFKIPEQFAGEELRLSVRLLFRAFPPHQLRRLGIGNLAERFPVFEMGEYNNPAIPVRKSARQKGITRVPEDIASLAEAIEEAASGTVISVAPGTYQLAEPLRFPGRDFVLESREGPEKTILSGPGTRPAAREASLLIFTEGETAAAAVRGFTIRNGRGTVLDGRRAGGALICIKSSPTIEGNIFIGNEADTGGAACLQDSESRFIDNRFTSNRAQAGGAIHISSGSLALLSKNSFTDNRAPQGGAVHIDSAGALIYDNRMVANRAFSGGAIRISSATPEAPNRPWLTSLSRNRLYGNTARSGGAILVEGACRLLSTRDLIAGNIGGGLSLLSGARAELDHATIVDNRLGKGALSSEPGSPLAVRNSILWGNRPLDLAGNLSWSLVENEAFAGETNIRALPLFRPPYSEWERCGDRGGLCVPILRPDAETLDPDDLGLYRKYTPGLLELFTDSPAADAGDPASTPDEDGTRTDLGFLPKLKSRRLFVRGDVDGNGNIDVSDARAIFALIDEKRRIECMESADVDGNGIIDRKDGIRLMNFVMTGQKPPPSPWPDCGPTPQPGGLLGCFEDRCKP